MNLNVKITFNPIPVETFRRRYIERSIDLITLQVFLLSVLIGSISGFICLGADPAHAFRKVDALLTKTWKLVPGTFILTFSLYTFQKFNRRLPLIQRNFDATAAHLQRAQEAIQSKEKTLKYLEEEWDKIPVKVNMPKKGDLPKLLEERVVPSSLVSLNYNRRLFQIDPFRGVCGAAATHFLKLCREGKGLAEINKEFQGGVPIEAALIQYSTPPTDESFYFLHSLWSSVKQYQVSGVWEGPPERLKKDPTFRPIMVKIFEETYLFLKSGEKKGLGTYLCQKFENNQFVNDNKEILNKWMSENRFESGSWPEHVFKQFDFEVEDCLYFDVTALSQNFKPQKGFFYIKLATHSSCHAIGVAVLKNGDFLCFDANNEEATLTQDLGIWLSTTLKNYEEIGFKNAYVFLIK